MRRDAFLFSLPRRLIAQKKKTPAVKIRLLVLDRATGTISHTSFADIINYVTPGDLLVLNDTAVIPTRFWGVTAHGAQVEVTLVQKRQRELWEALLRPADGIRRGTRITFPGTSLTITVRGKTSSGEWMVYPSIQGTRLLTLLHRYAMVNTPLYIRRAVRLAEYQNCYAQSPGSTQCPTAGLHFTPSLLRQLRAKGVTICRITLHVGGSVLPVTGRDFSRFRLHREYYLIGKKTASRITRAKRDGRRIIAVGTTVMRALESAATAAGRLRSGGRWTHLTIKPGYRFKIVSSFLTNFHLPGSSHLLLTSAFTGNTEYVLAAYRKAVRKQYAFLDFGDAMFIP